MMLLKCCTQYASKFGKLSSAHRTGMVQFSFQSQRRAMPKECSNCHTIVIISHASKVVLKILQARLQQWSENFQIYKLDLEKSDKSEFKLPASAGSWEPPVAHMVKNLTAMQETQVWSLGQEDPKRGAWQPMPVFLPGESQGWGSLVACHLWGRTESDTTEVTQQQQQQQQQQQMFFWNSLAFLMIQWMLAIWSLVPLAFLNPENICKFSVHVLLKPSLENFEHYFASMWDECNCAIV